MKTFSHVTTLIAILPIASAFVAIAPPASPSGSAFALHAERASSNVVPSSRRSFVSVGTAFVAAAAVVASPSTPAFAEDPVDDLAMPTEEEQKKADVSVLCSPVCLNDHGYNQNMKT
jgi:hypothetical protein